MIKKTWRSKWRYGSTKKYTFRELKSSNKDLNITEEQVNTLLNTITGNIEDLETTETPTEVETPDETPTEQPDTGDISIESLFEDSIKALDVRNNIGEIELVNTIEYSRNLRNQMDDVQKINKLLLKKKYLSCYIRRIV